MVDPVTTGSLLAGGASAWFAGKVFGPSVDALGESLKVYLQSQMPRIFERAGQIAQSKDLELSEISPGLLTRMVVDASSAGDSEGLREWWANLFVDASLAEVNTHATLSDMMSMVGPTEAAVLKDFYSKIASIRPDTSAPWKCSRFIVDHYVNEFMSIDIGYRFPIDLSELDEVNRNIEQFRRQPLPALPVAWSVPTKAKIKVGDSGDIDVVWPKNHKMAWFVDNQISFEILERARIIRISRHRLSRGEGRTGWVEFIEFTQLGMRFYETCEGINFNWKV